MLEGTDRRTVGAALPELLGSIYCEFFVRKLNNGKANKPIRSRCPNANVNEIIIVKPSTNSASCGKYSFASNAYDLHPCLFVTGKADAKNSRNLSLGGKSPMSNDLPRMPDPVENNSFIPTLDRQGAIWLYVDEITQAYLDFASQTKGTLLEIAAGYGHIVIRRSKPVPGKCLPMRSMQINWP